MTHEKTAFACKECGQEFTMLSDMRAHSMDAHAAPAIQSSPHTALRSSSFRRWMPAVILGILTLLAIAQTIEVANLRSMAASGKSIAPNNNLQGVNLPPSLQNLPNMVGGC